MRQHAKADLTVVSVGELRGTTNQQPSKFHNIIYLYEATNYTRMCMWDGVISSSRKGKP